MMNSLSLYSIRIRGFIVLFFALIICNGIDAQITYNPRVESRNNHCDIVSVELTNENTIVTIRVPKKHHKSAKISSATVICYDEVWSIKDARGYYADFLDIPSSITGQLYRDVVADMKERRESLAKMGFLIKNLGSDQLDTSYKPKKGADSFDFKLYFNRLPYGIEKFYIRELSSTGWEWYGISVDNPYPRVENTGYSETTIKSAIDKQNDGITGIYQGLTQKDYQYTLGCIKESGNYKFVYLGSKQNLSHWNIGEVKAILYPTSSQFTFKMDYYMANKTKNSDCYVTFEGATMRVFIGGEEERYIKMYPESSQNPQNGNSHYSGSDWSGTGFAIGKGFVVTNYHVVENAKSIKVQGIQGDFASSFDAIVVALDKNNDLAVLKINDNRFTSFGTIPYNVKTSLSDVGEDIFVLGYPLTSTMGDEIKLTTGVISSRTGFQSDVSQYQISAPIQPGNSGGPLFDSKGNVIGIVSAKHAGAENVGYAIKASYLNNLNESSLGITLPSNNLISTLSLSEKVKKIKNFIFLITCSSK